MSTLARCASRHQIGPGPHDALRGPIAGRKVDSCAAPRSHRWPTSVALSRSADHHRDEGEPRGAARHPAVSARDAVERCVSDRSGGGAAVGARIARASPPARARGVAGRSTFVVRWPVSRVPTRISSAGCVGIDTVVSRIRRGRAPRRLECKFGPVAPKRARRLMTGGSTPDYGSARSDSSPGAGPLQIALDTHESTNAPGYYAGGTFQVSCVRRPHSAPAPRR